MNQRDLIIILCLVAVPVLIILVVYLLSSLAKIFVKVSIHSDPMNSHFSNEAIKNGFVLIEDINEEEEIKIAVEKELTLAKSNGITFTIHYIPRGRQFRCFRKEDSILGYFQSYRGVVARSAEVIFFKQKQTSQGPIELRPFAEKSFAIKQYLFGVTAAAISACLLNYFQFPFVLAGSVMIAIGVSGLFFKPPVEQFFRS